MSYNKYKFEALKRKCGHIEDCEVTTATVYEPSAKKGQEAQDCTACRKQAWEALRAKEQVVIDKAKAYFTEKGVDISTASFSAVNAGTVCEVTFWIR